MAFGISPDTLALKPSTLIQDRAEKARRQQEESQYQRSRQDIADRFAQTMATNESTRKADFAKTQFLEEQKALRERAKTKAGLLDDIAKENKKIEDDISSKAWTASLANGDIENIEAYKAQIRKTLYPQTIQQQPQVQQPQFQPAGAEGGYDLRTEQPPVQQGRRDISEMYPQQQAPEEGGISSYMQQILAGGEAPISGLLPTPPEQKAVPVPDYLRREAGVQPAPTPAPPAPKKPEIPEAVIKTGYVTKWRVATSRIKRDTQALKQIDNQKAKLEKFMESKGVILNPTKYKADLVRLTTKQDKLKGNIQGWEDEIVEMDITAREKWEAKQEKLKEKGFTPIQKQKINGVRANLKRSKRVVKEFGVSKTIKVNSLDEALDYIIAENLSPELFTKELTKWGGNDLKNIEESYNKLRENGVSKEEAMQRLGMDK